MEISRDKEIRDAIDTIIPILPSNNGRTYEQALIASGFEAGVKWADSHPKSPWISIKDDLPCNHEELIIDTPLYKRTQPIVCNKPCGTRVDQMVYDMSFNEWYWTGETPTHWFLAPELPKE